MGGMKRGILAAAVVTLPVMTGCHFGSPRVVETWHLRVGANKVERVPQLVNQVTREVVVEDWNRDPEHQIRLDGDLLTMTTSRYNYRVIREHLDRHLGGDVH